MQPFKLSDKSSNYEVKLDSKRQVLSIGCRNYKAEHIKDAFTQVLNNGLPHHRGISSDGKGMLMHKDMGISVEDAKLILQALNNE